jgi:ATP phosphoribosyltransferase regulatory subunit
MAGQRSVPGVKDSEMTRLPEGVKDFLPCSAGKIEYLQQVLQGVYREWGYRPIITPSLEYLHILERGLGETLREKTFRLDDRQSGKLVAFSPDITPQVARIVATRMREYPLPLRLCYSGRVLRYTEQKSGKEREIFQSGAELIGLRSAEADAEMVAMAVEGFRALGAMEFSIDIGQVEFFHGVMNQLDLTPSQARRVQGAIARKDLSELEALLGDIPVDDSRREEVLALPRLYGGREVLDRAAAVVTNPESQGALENLTRVLTLLDRYGVSENITFDLGEIRGLDYHTGLIFQGYLQGIGREVCSGGRYDNLVERYGLSVPATGFTFSLLGLLSSLGENVEENADEKNVVLVFQEGNNQELSFEVARVLRRHGYPVVREISSRTLDETMKYARLQESRLVLVVDEKAEKVRVIDIAKDLEETFPLQEVLSAEFKLDLIRRK